MISKIDVAEKSNDYFFKANLDGIEQLFRLTWNFSGEFWVLGVYIDSENPIIQGMKVVPCYPLNININDFVCGMILCDTTLQRLDIDSFVNKNASLIYVSNEEIKSWQKSSGRDITAS